MKKIVMDGDFMYPVKEYDNNIPIILNETNISLNLSKEISDWAKKYDTYAPMTKAELKPHLLKIENLDKEGIELLKKIRDNAKGELVADKYYYFSLCLDKPIIVLYKDGGEKYL